MSDTQDLARQIPHIVQQLKFSTNAIESAVELINGQPASKQLAGSPVTRINESVKVIRTTVNDLLDAYMSSHSSPALLRDARLSSLVDQAAMRTLNSFRGRGQRLIVQVPDGIVIEASSGLIVEGVSELLANASRNSPTRSTVEVRAFAESGWAELSVSNEGPPVPDDLLEDLGQPPEPLEPERERPRFIPAESGLRTVKRIAEHHLGELRHEETEIARTVFILRLPLATESMYMGERQSA